MPRILSGESALVFGSPGDFNEKGVKEMTVQTELKMGKTPRIVPRGVKCQDCNEVGIDWLRISIHRQYLKRFRSFLDFYFGKSARDDRGLWSYDSRYHWPNKASLHFDSDIDRCERLHRGKFSVEIPGRALRGISQVDLHLFLLSLGQFSPTCTRIDVFFDDYNRTVVPSDLIDIIKKNDYSGFRKARPNQIYDRGHLCRDEVTFGVRGGNGSGKYLRIYDKNLESKGKKNCIRYEVEFCKKRAHKVFDRLSQTTSIDAFATLCGSLVGGSVKFIHRSNHDKHLCRLAPYDFWQKIQLLLGVVYVRVPVKETDMAAKYKYIYKQVTPTLALIRDTFVDDVDFFNWLFDCICDGQLRMNQTQMNLAEANKRNLRYDDGKVFNNDNVIVA